MKVYELMIVGGGPAGLSAGIYAGRYKLDTIIITKDIGGMAATAHKVCNFPSYPEISGAELTQKMAEHVAALKVPLEYGYIERISRVMDEDKREELFEVTLSSGKKFLGKKMIFAAGGEHRKLGVRGEDKLLGRGVSYCATCDAGFFNDRRVAVVGGGNTAITSALLLAEHAAKVYIIYRKESFFRAEPAWVESVNRNDKIEAMFNEEIVEISGDKAVTGVKLKSGKELKLDGVFVEIGLAPNTGLLKDLNPELSDGLIKVDGMQKTTVKGLFAAGDLTTGSNRFQQIVTACAEGVVAVDSVFKELKGAGTNGMY